MSLIIILIALAFEHFVDIFKPFRNYHWVEKYLSWWQSKLKNSPALTIAGSVISILLLVLIVQGVLASFFYGVLGWLFELLILLYCLGDYHLRQQFEQYLEIAKDNQEEANDFFAKHFVTPPPVDSSAISFVEVVLHEANARIFSVILWFVLLGPVGAVLYRLLRCFAGCVQEDGEGTSQLADKLVRVLDWLPVRLTAFSFCLVGNFTVVFPKWCRLVKAGLGDVYRILTDCGKAALNISEESEEAAAPAQLDAVFSLNNRSLLVWLVVLALVLLF